MTLAKTMGKAMPASILHACQSSQVNKSGQSKERFFPFFHGSINSPVWALTITYPQFAGMVSYCVFFFGFSEVASGNNSPSATQVGMSV